MQDMRRTAESMGGSAAAAPTAPPAHPGERGALREHALALDASERDRDKYKALLSDAEKRAEQLLAMNEQLKTELEVERAAGEQQQRVAARAVLPRKLQLLLAHVAHRVARPLRRRRDVGHLYGLFRRLRRWQQLSGLAHARPRGVALAPDGPRGTAPTMSRRRERTHLRKLGHRRVRDRLLQPAAYVRYAIRICHDPDRSFRRVHK